MEGARRRSASQLSVVDIERRIEIAAPPARVWAVMSDVARWPEWTASVTSVEPLDGAPLGTGRRYRVRQPRLAAAVWTVTTLEPERGFTWRAVVPGLTSEGVHRIEASGTGSRVTLGIAWSGPLAIVIRLIFGGLSRRYVDLEAEGLKRRSEAGPT